VPDHDDDADSNLERQKPKGTLGALGDPWEHKVKRSPRKRKTRPRGAQSEKDHPGKGKQDPEWRKQTHLLNIGKRWQPIMPYEVTILGKFTPVTTPISQHVFPIDDEKNSTRGSLTNQRLCMRVTLERCPI
jgi:hypothetical protein